jgi:hypothetical protein
MRKQILSLAVLGSILFSLVGCALQRSYDADALKTIPLLPMTAKIFPEIEISAGPLDNSIVRGKILELSGTSIKFLPYPYGDKTPIEVEIKDIRSVKLLDKRNWIPLDAFTGAMLGFTVGFIVETRANGTNPNNHYKEDYENSRHLAWSKGFVGGLIGMVLGIVSTVIQNTAKTSNYSKMSESEKITALRKIMGLRKGE